MGTLYFPERTDADMVCPLRTCNGTLKVTSKTFDYTEKDDGTELKVNQLIMTKCGACGLVVEVDWGGSSSSCYLMTPKPSMMMSGIDTKMTS